jgi:opacity protein-like surface antigen
MRTFFIAVLAAGLSVPALAADLDHAPLRGTHYGSSHVAIQNWEGIYVGGMAGLANSNANMRGIARDLITHDFRRTLIETERRISELPEPGDADARARAYGAFFGYNMQFDEVVLGIEADYTRTRLNGVTTDSIARSFTLSNGDYHRVGIDTDARADIKDYATLRARAGYTMGAFMPFVTAGVAIGRADVSGGVDIRNASYNVAEREAWLIAREAFMAGTRAMPPAPLTSVRGYRSFDPFTGTGTPIVERLERARRNAMSVGFTGGLGIDVAVTQNLFLRAEWQYIHFRDFAGVQASINNVRAAAGLKF